MAKEDKIIIEVEVNAGKSAEDLANVRSRMDALKEAQKLLKREMKEYQTVQLKNGQLNSDDAKVLAELNKQYANNAADLKQLTAQEKVYTSQIQIATQNDRKLGDSITELSAQLAQLKQEYRSLSAEQRESAEGKEMLKNIQALDEQVKQADFSLGDFQRNVGNYSSALLGLGGNATKVASLFQNGFANGITAAKNSLASFAKTMLTTPFGLVMLAIRGLTTAFDSLREAIKRSDDVGTEFQKNMAQVEVLKTRWRSGWNEISATTVTSITNIINWLEELDRKMAKSWPGKRAKEDAEAMEKASGKLKQEWKDLIAAEDRNEDRQRAYDLAHEDRLREIADLRVKAYAADKYTLQERQKFYNDMLAIEKKDLAERRVIAVENDALVTKRNKLMGDTSDEAKNREVQARLEVKRIDREYAEFEAGVTKKLVSLNNQIAASYESTGKDVGNAVEDEAKRVAEARREEIEETRKLQDLQRQLVTDDVQRRRMDISATYGRQIEDLQDRLNTEEELTIDQKKRITSQIKALETLMWKELAEIDEQQLKKNNELIEKMEKEAAERLDEQVKERHQARLLEMQNEYSKRLNVIFGNPAKIAQVQLEEAEKYNEYLVNLDKQTKDALYKSDAEYTAALLDSQAKVLEARKRAADALQSQIRDFSNAMSTMTSALSDLFESAAGDTETYEKFKKAMAIVDATIGMATAIAQATAVSTEGDPYTMAIRIATNVAAVTAQFAALIKALKAAAIPSAPTFAEGGIVPGDSWTGDKVVSRLNSGEMVLTKEQQLKLFDLIQAGVPQGGIDYRLMARAVAEGVAALPAPVLDYSEFTRFERKVRQVERFTRL